MSRIAVAELIAIGIPALVVHGKRDRRLWSADEYAAMASRLAPAT